MGTTSKLPGLHSLSRDARLAKVGQAAALTEDEISHLIRSASEDGDLAENLSENVIGVMSIPLGVATNLIVDGLDVLVPMATEESSVIAAVCNGAKACRSTGGVVTDLDPPHMIAQIQLKNIPDLGAAIEALTQKTSEIKDRCDALDPTLVGLGGGFQTLDLRHVGNDLVVHLVVDVRDAMGANAVNTMAEALAPSMEAWTGGTVGLKILSNLADRRLARAKAVWRASEIGADVVDGIIDAFQFADADPYRAATHNKGIMNGISAVALATGNDTRALEAGAHAFASRDGYGPISRYRKTPDGDLEGEIELPTAVGIIGGATKAHPTAQIALKIMEATTAARLASIICATGLVQNFSALRALATEGIQRGHMSLHARNVAIAAGATGDLVAEIARQMIATQSINDAAARDLLALAKSGTP